MNSYGMEDSLKAQADLLGLDATILNSDQVNIIRVTTMKDIK
jgi:hypothetical protein